MSIALDLAFGCKFIGFLVWLLLEEVVLVIIFPSGFGAHTQLLHAFDAITQHGASIAIHTALHVPLIVVDEEAAWSEILKVCVVLHILLVQGEVVGCCQGICRTAAQVTLIENWEATIQGPQIYHFLPTLALLMNLLGSLFGGGESHEQVTVIWDIRNPSHLLRARQGQALQGCMPAGVHDDLRIVGGFACASAHEFECEKELMQKGVWNWWFDPRRLQVQKSSHENILQTVREFEYRCTNKSDKP